MKKKKMIAGALCMAYAITALAGCGKEGNQEGTPTNQPQVTEPGGLQNPTEGANSGDEQNQGEISEPDIFQEMEEKVIYENGALSAKQEKEGWSFTNGQMRLEYNAKEGTAQIFTAAEEMPLILEACAKVTLKDGTELVSKDLKREGEGSITVEAITDGFGEGMQIRIANIGEEADIAQYYYFYQELPYFLCEAVACAKEGEEVSTNYIAPIYACKGDFKTNVLSLEGEDPRFLFVPYDNDAFIRYSSQPLIAAAESYEVTAIFDNTARKGFVVGSVTHDTWKTGVRVRQGGIDATVEFTVYGGASSAITRDHLPHGYVSGRTVSSPKIFFGYFDDYRDAFVRAWAEPNGVEDMDAFLKSGGQKLGIFLEGEEEDKTAFVNELAIWCQGQPGFKAYKDGPARREEDRAMYGGLLFIGVIFGLIFFLCLIIIMYYKQVSEGYEDQTSFDIMQKVGMSDGEIKHTIHRQILLVFGLPLVGALAHTAAGMFMVDRLMVVLGFVDIRLLIGCTIGICTIFILIYAVSYTITARTYYRIVRHSF